MPARLNVILIESAPDAGSARRMAEAAVGELIGLAGIDLTLVDSLVRMSETSTDKLTLDGITGDACVLDWQPPESIISSLQAKGFIGRRSPHPHDPDAATVSSSAEKGLTRRIYAFELNRFSDAKSLCDALQDLRSVREVRTFSLVPPATSTPRSGEKPRVVTGSDHSTGQPASQATDESPVTALGHVPLPKPRIGEIDLESLVDQLDDFDS